MSALTVIEPAPQPADPLTARLDDLILDLGGYVSDSSPAQDGVRIDRIARLEKLRAATAALQAAETVRFARSQVAEQLAQDVHPDAIGRGIGDQIALACKISPSAGSHRLAVARALWFELPETFTQLTAGELSEQVAESVVRETRHLDAPTRLAVDAQIAAAGITTLGPRAAAACARRLAYEADPQRYLERGRTERKHRRVGIRPAPDTMAILRGYLPVEQGVACYASLRKHTDSLIAGGDPRTRDQIMADTLVERLTGQAQAEDVNIEVNLTMPLSSLTDPGDRSAATIPGYGPLPGPVARHIVQTSQGRRWWRRLFTRPSHLSPDGMIIGGDPARRRFDGWLAQLISLRDQTCRDPFCDAPIRHHDHIVRFADGGPTTLANGRGVCARGNYVREMPGWQIILNHDGSRRHPHTITVITPTGHRYRSRAPDP